VRRSRVLSLETTFTRHCPETGDEVDVEVELRGTWCPGEPGTYLDPPVPAGVEDLWVVANGQDARSVVRWCPETGVRLDVRGVNVEVFPLSYRERDWAAEMLGEGA
jgi:hypothetical protein